MNYQQSFFLAFSYFLITSTAFAQPNITNVSGSFDNNETIVVTGSGFSTKSQAAPLLSSYNNPSAANNWSNGSVSGLWEIRDDDGTLELSNGFTRSQNPQNAYNIAYDAAGGYNSIRYAHGVPEDQIYVSFWMYRDSTTFDLAGTEMNSKFFRIYNSMSVGDANLVWSIVDRESVGADIYKSYMSGDYLGSDSAWSIDYTAPVCNATKGQSSILYAQTKLTGCMPNLRSWEHYEVLIEYPSSLGAANGRILQIKNGATVAQSSNIMMGEAGQSQTMRFPMFGQVSGGRNHSYNEYIDQVYIDNTPAHVYLSDSPNASWPNIDHFNHSEIQVASAWSDNAITFTLNQGSFSTNEVYLYIVDNNGESNTQGYPLTLGGEVDGGTNPISMSSPLVNLIIGSQSTSNQITLTLRYQGLGTVSRYRILRNGTELSDTANSSYVDSGLTPTTTYIYTISALDGNGTSLEDITHNTSTK